eukprot:667503-Rhodomonas_salina.1
MEQYSLAQALVPGFPRTVTRAAAAQVRLFDAGSTDPRLRGLCCRLWGNAAIYGGNTAIYGDDTAIYGGVTLLFMVV